MFRSQQTGRVLRRAYTLVRYPAARNRDPGAAIIAGMKDSKKLLKKLDEEGDAAEKLLAEKKRLLKRAPNKLEKENAKRVLKSVELAAKAIAEHREIVEDDIKKDGTAG